jgi:hypothetical protein
MKKLILLLSVCSIAAKAQTKDSSNYLDINSPFMERHIYGTDTVYVEDFIGKQAANNKSSKIVYKRVEFKMPTFKGNLDEFIKANIHLLPSEKGGKVVAYIHFDKTGKIDKEPIITHYLSTRLDQEVIRIIKLMPPWEPGRDEHNNPMAMDYSVVFNIK